MVAPMKTTIEIPDPLFRQARESAKRQGITMKLLIEQALRKTLAESQHKVPFKLREGSVNGQGLSAEFSDASWTRLRDASYHSTDS